MRKIAGKARIVGLSRRLAGASASAAVFSRRHGASLAPRPLHGPEEAFEEPRYREVGVETWEADAAAHALDAYADKILRRGVAQTRGAPRVEREIDPGVERDLHAPLALVVAGGDRLRSRIGPPTPLSGLPERRLVEDLELSHGSRSTSCSIGRAGGRFCRLAH